MKYNNKIILRKNNLIFFFINILIKHILIYLFYDKKYIYIFSYKISSFHSIAFIRTLRFFINNFYNKDQLKQFQ